MVRFTPLIIALAAGSATACTNAPQIFTKTILGLPAGSFQSTEINFKNPNCQNLGYSYGYKFDKCVNKSYSSAFKLGGVVTKGDTCPSTLAADVVCDKNGIDATITPNENVVVIMKGGTVGGTVYKLEAGQSVKVDVGARQDISHMEFCFICDECGAPGPASMSAPAPAEPVPAPAEPVPAPADEPKGKPADAGKPAPAEPAPAPAEPVPAPADEPKGQPADAGKPAPAEPAPAPAEPVPAPADEPKGKPADEPAPAPPSEPTVCADAESMAVDPPKTLYEIAMMGEQYFPKCGDLGQNEAFQGQDLETNRGCVRVNICHGNAGFGWNRITVDRSAIGVDNNGQGGHAKFEHNDPSKNKRPDYFPGSYSVSNPNGAGKNGYLDSMCNFVPGCPTGDEPPEPVIPGGDEPEVLESFPPPDADPEGDAADEKAFTRGDPHFKTFGGELYDYHGQCDLVLLDNPKFKNGLGMTAHIRTKIQDFWSSVESAALKIGDDFLEISGGGGKEWLWVNGVANEELEEEKWYRTSLSGFLVRFKQTGSVREANIYLEGSKEVLVMKTYHDFVRVDFKWQESENYGGSVGLLGARDLNGARVGRDGVTEISDVNAFGQEWQVKEDEDKLFHNYDETVVQAPAKCVLPPSMTDEKIALRKRRLAESDLTVEKAEKACEHVHGAAERKACAYDILATQDINMAGAW